MINTVIKQIEGQQAGKENTAPYYVGEQLKDIIRNNPQAAEKAEQAAKKSKQKAKNAEQQYKKLQDDVSSERKRLTRQKKKTRS